MICHTDVAGGNRKTSNTDDEDEDDEEDENENDEDEDKDDNNNDDDDDDDDDDDGEEDKEENEDKEEDKKEDKGTNLRWIIESNALGIILSEEAGLLARPLASLLPINALDPDLQPVIKRAQSL
ncbi:hypothetical protein V1478_013295 [Vespula squamosa]|uniref:Uncharacterized protein n=1 Tax=Vespula squamosa TaxID=30214 RepID=A0ABD2ACL2_VESSQ